MIQHSLRPILGLALTFGLVLALGCSPAPRTPAPTPSPEQNLRLRQRVEELSQRSARLDDQLDRLRAAQMQQLAALTSDSQSLRDELNRLTVQLGGKALPASAPPATPAPHAKGPLSPLIRFVLIIIMLFALWFMARIFLGRLGEEDEEEEDSPAESADDYPASDEDSLANNRDVQPEERPRPEDEDAGGNPKA